MQDFLAFIALVLIIFAAWGDPNPEPLTPRRKIYRRRAWAKLLREEELEAGLPVVGEPIQPGPVPQARYSDRR